MKITNHPPESPPASDAKNTTPAGKWRKWTAAVGVLVAALAGIAELTGYSLKDLWSVDAVDSFSLTVLVHGKQGKDDRILKNQGQVLLEIGSASHRATINEKGEATFKELPAGFIGKKALVSITHPQPYFPVERDTTYLLEKGHALYLEIELKGMDKVQGRILDFGSEKPLDSVRVSHRNVATYSDAFGWFELAIPAENQAKFIKLNLYKPGYKMENIDSIAPHTRQELGLTLQKE